MPTWYGRLSNNPERFMDESSQQSRLVMYALAAVAVAALSILAVGVMLGARLS